VAKIGQWLVGMLAENLRSVHVYLQLGGWFIFMHLDVLVEHQVHRKLMHRTNFLGTYCVLQARI
jgi:hypothetical protein